MKKIPILDLSYQYHEQRQETLEVIEKVLEQGQYILGENVAQLEREVADYCGTKYGIGVANGTDALTLALYALGIGPGDEVITTPFTFFATVEAIMQVGAIPVFADVDRETFNLDPQRIKDKITAKTKAIMPVHLFGQMAEMSEIRAIADLYGLLVVEDACQAIGASWEGKGIGYFGDAAAISFFPTKNLGGYGDGGMILVSNQELAERIRTLRVHGSKVKYIHEELGWNSRLDELQAAILRLKLKRLDDWNRQRRVIAARYDEFFTTLKLQVPRVSKNAYHIYHLYTIQTDRRDELKAHLIRNGIGCGVYYPVPLHLQTALRSLGYREGDLKTAESLAKTCLSLPLYPGLKVEDQLFVVQQVERFFQT